MFKSTSSYEPVNSPESHAELADWQDPEESVETRNRPIGIHHRPGFYSKALLVSVGLNAILLMVVGLQYLRLRGQWPILCPSAALADSCMVRNQRMAFWNRERYQFEDIAPTPTPRTCEIRVNHCSKGNTEVYGIQRLFKAARSG
ncbi:MAG: hypothetical protein Q9163_003960 [Psora crenata]